LKKSALFFVFYEEKCVFDETTFGLFQKKKSVSRFTNINKKSKEEKAREKIVLR